PKWPGPYPGSCLLRVFSRSRGLGWLLRLVLFHWNFGRNRSRELSPEWRGEDAAWLGPLLCFVFLIAGPASGIAGHRLVYQSEPKGWPSPGLQAYVQVVQEILVETARTLPSPSATIKAPG